MGFIYGFLDSRNISYSKSYQYLTSVNNTKKGNLITDSIGIKSIIFER